MNSRGSEMKNKLYCKILAVGIIVLFVGVSVSSAIRVDNKPLILENQNEKDCGCNEVSDSDLIREERLLYSVDSYINIIQLINRNNSEIVENCNELLTIISIDGNDGLFCDILMRIGIFIEELAEKIDIGTIMFFILELMMLPIILLWNEFCE
jgi:hypothetical protein